MNQDFIPCPFCNQQTLEIIKQFSIGITTKSGFSAKKYSYHSGDVLVSAECSNCHKTEAEIKKEYKKKYNYNLR